MRLHFEPDLDFQRAAIESVCDLFRGQEICRSEFTVTMTAPADAQQASLSYDLNALGIGNRLQLLDDDVLKNLKEIQERNGLRPSEELALGMVEWHGELAPAAESTVVFRDSAFADDVAKTNLTAILEQHGLKNVRSL